MGITRGLGAQDAKRVQYLHPPAATLSTIMTTAVISIGMDATLSSALELCVDHGIRHLPVVDEQNRLVGILTDRDIRYHMSPRLGTLSENGSDRESLHRHVHVLMTRRVVFGMPEMILAEAASRMLHARIGCLPVVDEDSRLVGIVTTSDFLQFLAETLPY
jgi:acetoin utilization protein AcuB